VKILLAVSGGIDSMYMAERAPELFPGAVFAIAHCNFSLRGEESDSDEVFVREWARKHGLEFFSVRFDTLSYSAEKSLSTEMAARELRYRWFADLLREHVFDTVAIAHNACDNAETFFLNLIRGTGTRGLRGMERDTVIEGARVLRPLLGTGREEIEEWMTRNGKEWREDRTNSETLFRRNRIRHDIIPVLKDLNPSILKTLEKDMLHIREADEIASRYWEGAVSRGVVTFVEDGVRIDIEGLRREDSPRFILFRALEPFGFNEDTVDSAMTLLTGGRTVSGKIFEAHGNILEFSSAEIYVHPCLAEDSQSIEITDPGTYSISGISLEVSTLGRSKLEELKQPKGTVIFDSKKLPFPFVIRGWKQGDWMTPLGMKGKKKISDLFVDLKWGPEKKRSALVLDGGDPTRVLGLLGERIDDSVKIGPATTGVTKILLSLKPVTKIDNQ